MKKIVVPTDFSEQSEHALKVAASLAKKHGAEILALHMLELNQAIISSSEGFYLEQTVFLIKLAEKRFKDFLNKLLRLSTSFEESKSENSGFGKSRFF